MQPDSDVSSIDHPPSPRPAYRLMRRLVMLGLIAISGVAGAACVAMVVYWGLGQGRVSAQPPPMAPPSAFPVHQPVPIGYGPPQSAPPSGTVYVQEVRPSGNGGNEVTTRPQAAVTTWSGYGVVGPNSQPVVLDPFGDTSAAPMVPPVASIESMPSVHRLVDRIRNSGDAAQVEVLKGELSRLLSVEFDRRHQRQSMEIEQLQQRAARLREVAEQRQQRKAEIVQRRVDQLLAQPSIDDWDYQLPQSYSVAQNPYQPRVAAPVSVPSPYPSYGAAVSPPLQGGQFPGPTASTVPLSPYQQADVSSPTRGLPPNRPAPAELFSTDAEQRRRLAADFAAQASQLLKREQEELRSHSKAWSEVQQSVARWTNAVKSGSNSGSDVEAADNRMVAVALLRQSLQRAETLLTQLKTKKSSFDERIKTETATLLRLGDSQTADGELAADHPDVFKRDRTAQDISQLIQFWHQYVRMCEDLERTIPAATAALDQANIPKDTDVSSPEADAVLPDTAASPPEEAAAENTE